MKRYQRILLLVIALTAMFSSCKMDREPKSSINEGTYTMVLDDLAKWENGMIATLRARQGGIFDHVQDAMGDQLNAFVGFGNRGGAPHGWAAFNANDYDLIDVYSLYYSGIRDANYILEKLEKLEYDKTGTSRKAVHEQATVKRVKGTAHFVRAYYYFNLTLRFGRPYKAATASTDLAVPMVLKNEKDAKPARATNEAMYQQILKDIDEAIANLVYAKYDAKTETSKLLPIDAEHSATYISIDAATALKARVLFFMENWEGVIKEAKVLVDGGYFKLIEPKTEAFVKMWRGDIAYPEFSTEDILQLSISRPDEMPNTKGYYSINTRYANRLDAKINTPDWLPTQWMIDLYDAKDLRKPLFFEKSISINEGTPFIGVTIISKFKGNPSVAAVKNRSYWADDHRPNEACSPKVFRLAEQYLMLAEAYYNLGKEEDARKYLNDLRISRGLSAVNATGEKLFNEIKDERTRELAYEGFRLWDLRRWGMDMKRHDPQILYDKDKKPLVVGDRPVQLAPGYHDMVIPADHPKWVWGFPAADILTNPNLKAQQNPGW